MTEEEKKVIEYFKKSFTSKTPPYWYDDTIENSEIKIKTLVNLIEKLQKENEDSIPKDKIRKLEDMWNDNIWNATDDESEAKAEMIRDVYRELLNE